MSPQKNQRASHDENGESRQIQSEHSETVQVDGNSYPSDDSVITDPAHALGLVEAENRKLDVLFASSGQYLYVTWGLVWVVAYLVLAVSSLRNVGGPSGLAFAIYGLLLLAGVVVSIVCGVKSVHGRRGQSKIRGTVYGWSWCLAFVSGMFMCTGLVQRLNLSDDRIAILYNCIAVLIVGILYMSGSILDAFDLPMFLGGLLMLLMGMFMPFLSGTVGFFTMAVVGGGSFLLLAALVFRGRRGMGSNRTRR